MSAHRYPSIIPIALLLFCSFFVNTFASGLVVRVVLLCLSLVVALVVSFQARIRYFLNLPMVALILLWAMALFNQNHDLFTGDYSWLLFFSASLLVAVVLGFGEGSPFRGAVTIVALFGVFFSVMTIAMWVYQPLFEYAKEVFFSGSVSARSYRSGFTAHYSTNAIYITFGIICTLALLLNERTRKLRVLYLAALVACFFALLLTTKRAHLVIAVVACVSMYLLSGGARLGKRTVGLMTWGVVALVIFSAASQYIPELSMTIDRIVGLSDDDTFGSRADLYAICVDLWKDSPIIGNGWGSFTETLYGSSSGTRFAAQGYFEIDAHNVFLQVLAEGGVVGLGLFLAWGIGCLIQTGGLAKASKKDETYRIIAIASWGVQLFFLVYCFTGNPLYDLQMFIPCLLLGFGGYLHCWNAKRKEACQETGFLAVNGPQMNKSDLMCNHPTRNAGIL